MSPSRLNSKAKAYSRIYAAALLGAVTMIAPGFAAGQSAQSDQPAAEDFPISDPQSPIVTIDLDRLFEQSLYGQRLLADLQAQRDALIAENRTFAEDLRARELDLAQRRPTMEPESFQQEAALFDQEAQRIRDEQDAKQRALEAALASSQERFSTVVNPILADLMVERNAYAILDQRAIILSLDRIDVTADAIARVDEVLGAGEANSP